MHARDPCPPLAACHDFTPVLLIPAHLGPPSQLIAAGKTVVAAARTAETAKAQLAEAGLQEGFQPSEQGTGGSMASTWTSGRSMVNA